MLQQAQVFHVGAAPGVDGLVVVADRGEHAALAGEQLHQLVLAGIGVLVFVDQQVAQLVLPRLQHLGIAAQQLHRQADQVVEIQCLVGGKRVLVGHIGGRGHAVEFIAGGQ